MCWSSTSPWGSRSRAAPAPRAISTACWRCCATRPASGRAWCTASTRTPPAAFWWRRRGSPPPRWRRPSAAARRARSIGRWSPACRAAPGPHLDLPGQGGARGRKLHAHRPAWRGGREPRRHLLRRGRDRRPEARLAVAQAGDRTHPSAARPHGPYRPPDRGDPNISTSRIGSCRAACRTSCTSWRAASRCRIRAAAWSTSRRRCRPTCCRPGTCSASTPSAYDPILDAPEE